MATTPSETGLIGGVEKSEIKIVDYDPAWRVKYGGHRDVIAQALSDAALRIEHVGSTSVPGLVAKAIIDILVVVRNSADEATYRPQLEDAGYVLRVREPDWNEHRMLRTPEEDVHVHVFSANCPEIERLLTFRDRLRGNARDRLRYAELKLALAKQEWPDMNAYANAKTKVIEEIIAAAKSGK
jgi:GrpB-like predicted nucleotidyltransferase (UPF0157 family)